MIEDSRFAPTEEGTPQGGVISPLLLNVALHGMERAAGCRYRQDTAAASGGLTVPGTPVLVRYADLCRGRHKSAYAEVRVMPTVVLDPLVSAVSGPPLSA